MKEAKILFIILVVIVALAWGASYLGLTEAKMVAIGNYIVNLYEQTVDPETAPKPTLLPIFTKMEISEVEILAFDLINLEREKNGLQATKWDDKLYELSQAHTEEMADRGDLFHTPMGATYAENTWGASWGQTSRQNIAKTIVRGWMSSPLHRAWLLHKPLETSVVSVVDDDRGNFASWTFWMGEAGIGPPLINKAYNLWRQETGGKIPWLDWLDLKGYPTNTAFLD